MSTLHDESIYDDNDRGPKFGSVFFGARKHFKKKGHTPQKTAEQIELERQASEDIKDYFDRWVPLQNKFIAQHAGNRAQRAQRAQGVAGAETQTQFGKAEEALSKTQSNSGAALGSGRQVASLGDLKTAKASSLGRNLSATRGASEAQYVRGLQDIVSIGRGQKASSDQSAGALASISGRRAALDSEISLQNAQGLGQAIGTGVGVAGGYALDRVNNPPET